MKEAGYKTIWSFLSAVFIYGGTIQLLLVGLLKTHTPIIAVGLVSLFVNSRHMFYGLSFLQEFKKIRKESFLKFFYLAFSLTDEVYSLYTSSKFPERLDRTKTMLWINALSYFTWMSGCVLGNIAFNFISFSLEGIDFRKSSTQYSMDNLHKQVIKWFPADILLSKLSPYIIQSTFDKFACQYSYNYTKLALSLIRQSLKYARRMEYIRDISFLDNIELQKPVADVARIKKQRSKFLTKDELKMDKSRRYAGHQIQPTKSIALLKTRRWVVDDYEGLQKVYYKENIIAKMYAMTDWYSPAEVEAPTIEDIVFYDRKTFELMTIEDVPDLIFSEVMRDIDLVVSVAHVGDVDPEASQSTIEMRRAIVEFNAKLFKLKNVTFTESHALIKGTRAEYSIHLGSGVIHQKAGATIEVLPIHSQHRGRIFLPFIDEDPKTAEIMAKVLLFAQDEKIKDIFILEQII